jgi:mono/diheme cytochrome c family protein
MRPVKRFLLYAAIGLVVVFGLIQLVPYRVDNPSVHDEPAWDSPRTRRLAAAACFDCHSNDTATYWWEDVAPLSWWITNHVKEGRRVLNFSECVKRTGGESDDAAETVTEGSMPPDYYTWLGLHSGAELSAQERTVLASGLRSTMRGWSCGDGED